ncbi:MAG: B12-binding domain-containing radical SAM protein [Planctomycetota bacterium]|jgi:radical SAM superfamily enzyme YgiQ (UPF0313 family)
MRILLVNIGDKTQVRMPQGLVYVASAVQAAGHVANIHDEVMARTPQQSLERILTSDADVIGISILSVPSQLRRAEELSRAIKATHKRTLIVWGGWHPTLYPKHSILNEDVDIVVRGPGEKPVCELLDALEHGRSFRNISGLLLNDNGRTGETDSVCLDPRYLYPDLDFGLIDLNAYLKRHDGGAGGVGILHYITSRGCRYACRFCAMARVFGGCLVRKPANQVLNELRVLLQNPQIRAVSFSDDNAFTDDTEALELCRIINSAAEGRRIPWRCTTRIDTLCRLSESTYETLIASGCRGVMVGVESSSDRLLRLMGKGFTTSQIHKALALIKNKGLEANQFNFLWGFTGETSNEARDTLRLAQRTRLMFPGSDLRFCVYCPGFADPCWLPAEAPPSSVSSVLQRYDAKHRAYYRIAGHSLRVIQYYFKASERRNGNSAHVYRFFRSVYQRLLLLRIRYGVFTAPFEYYLFGVIFKGLKGGLAWRKSSGRSSMVENKQNE